ncbi:hypothetical protein JW905_05235, partial [bacterium]|nr:hypothetical protein [candidate division CSSED10-310 bacterium]
LGRLFKGRRREEPAVPSGPTVQESIEQPDGVRIFYALSPFCDPRINEPTINVASALAFLTPQFKFDYYFYCYGSQLMTTRKVNQDAPPVNLSLAVSFIGSKADGGHAEAATGRPIANPEFPMHRFARVNDRNLHEYGHYLADRMSAFTGMHVRSVRPVLLKERDKAWDNVLRLLGRNLVHFTMNVGDDTLHLTTTLLKFPPRGGPALTVPNALAFLQEEAPAHYQMLCSGNSRCFLINTGDRPDRIDLARAAAALGTSYDGGRPQIADFRPKYSPAFPVNHFRWVNDTSFLSFAHYLADAFREHIDGGHLCMVPAALSSFDKDFERVTSLLGRNVVQIILFPEKGVRVADQIHILAVLQPFTDKRKGEPPITPANAAAILASKGVRVDYLYFCEGTSRHSLVNMGDAADRINLQQLVEVMRVKGAELYGRHVAWKPMVKAQFQTLDGNNFLPFCNVMAEFLAGLSHQKVAEVRAIRP